MTSQLENSILARCKMTSYNTWKIRVSTWFHNIRLPWPHSKKVYDVKSFSQLRPHNIVFATWTSQRWKHNYRSHKVVSQHRDIGAYIDGRKCFWTFWTFWPNSAIFGECILPKFQKTHLHVKTFHMSLFPGFCDHTLQRYSLEKNRWRTDRRTDGRTPWTYRPQTFGVGA